MVIAAIFFVPFIIGLFKYSKNSKNHNNSGSGAPKSQNVCSFLKGIVGENGRILYENGRIILYRNPISVFQHLKETNGSFTNLDPVEEEVFSVLNKQMRIEEKLPK